VVARRVEWWNVKVPHCAACAKRLDNGELLGYAGGALCVVLSLALFPPEVISYSLFCYILFGYPANKAITTTRKGIVFGWADNKLISARIRHPEYFHALLSATHNTSPRR
jgi:hypothetical protein